MNTSNSTLIGLLLLTAAAVPGCLSTANKNNSYLNMVQPEHAESKHAEGKHAKGHEPTGEKPAEANHGEAKVADGEKAIEVVAKTEGKSLEPTQSTEPPPEAKAKPPKPSAKKIPAKPLTPAEKAKVAKLKTDLDAVEAVATKWMALVTSGRSDASEAVLDLYTKDAIFIGSDSAQVRDNPADIRSYFNYFTKLPELAITGYRGNVRVYGDSAIESGYYTFAYKAGEQRETIPARFSIHYRRVNGEWKINDHHSSRLPEAPASLKPAKNEG
jgi:uncharacterized protein (TIGR02246 family)